MTIGLAPWMARDGWGNFYTYAVSPVFTRKNDQTSSAADTGKVHGRCRHAGWVNASDRYNRNAIKARFCCADQAAPVFDVDSDLIILHTSGGAALSPVRTPGTMSNYDDLTKTTTYSRGGVSVPFMDTTPIEAAALVLVSHGPYGKGAWLGNGTNKPHDRRIPGRSCRTPTATRFSSMVLGSLRPGPAYFDNIVRWMTQDGIMAAHGALSCSYP